MAGHFQIEGEQGRLSLEKQDFEYEIFFIFTISTHMVFKK